MLVVPEHVLSDDGKSTRRGPNGELTITFSIPGFYKRTKFTILALLPTFCSRISAVSFFICTT